MTPFHLMSRQTFLGWFFLALGSLLITIAVAPMAIALVVALRTHAAMPAVTITMLFLAFLLTGIAVTVFGAWLLPSSGAPQAAQGFVAVFGPYVPSLRIPGLSRVDDPKPNPPSPPPSKSPDP